MLVNASRFAVVLAIAVCAAPLAHAGPTVKRIGVNVILSTDVTDAVLAELATHGTVADVLPRLRAVALQAAQSELPAIAALPFVASTQQDVVHAGAPVDTLEADSVGALGGDMWNLDVVNVTGFGLSGRTVSYDGTGVYIAVIDSGLLDSWRQYFPQQRIATEFAISFSGGAGAAATVSAQPNKWQHDQASHGTAVTGMILGFRDQNGTYWNGVAPNATVIPVKVLNQNDEGHTWVIARGITYVTELKTSGALGDSPVVVNLSISGGESDVEHVAIDDAIANGIIVVACAGNYGQQNTMTYPGAHPEVISVGAIGWRGQWRPDATSPDAATWWRLGNVPDPTNPADYYVPDFSGRERPGTDQQLDVLAPGIWVVAPWQVNSGQLHVTYVTGTSFASPMVAGIAALMLEKNPALTQWQVESILTSSAKTLPTASPPSCVTVSDPQQADGLAEACWGANAVGAGMVTADAALGATPGG